MRRWAVLLAVFAGCAADEPPRPATGDCAVGRAPGYFVPADRPVVLLGCVRLPESGRVVDFSWDDGGCVHPAYHGDSRGAFIPAMCRLVPPLGRFAVRDARQPRQAVRGYGYVIWGTAGSADEVVVRHAGATTRAAIIEGPSFRLFVTELPLSARCAPVTVIADGRREGLPTMPWSERCDAPPGPSSRSARGGCG